MSEDPIRYLGPTPQHPLEAPSPWSEAALAVDGALDYFNTLHEAPTALRAAFRIQMAVNDLVRAVRLSLPPVSLDGLHEPVEVQSES